MGAISFRGPASFSYRAFGTQVYANGNTADEPGRTAGCLKCDDVGGDERWPLRLGLLIGGYEDSYLVADCYNQDVSCNWNK